MTSKPRENRVEKILDALKKAASGNYSAKLDFASQDDDLSVIADAINTLLQKTDQRVRATGQTSTDLTEDTRRYRHILDSIEESYFEVDLKGNLVFFNDKVIRDLGYSQEELRGVHFHKLVDETNAGKVYNVFHQVFLTGRPIQGFDWEILKKNKEKVDVESSVTLLRDKTGKPAGFRGVVRNVSQRIQAQERLRQSEEKYRTILEIMEEGYIEDDLQGRIIFVNDAACRLMGHQREQLIGMHYRDYLTPAVAQAMKDIFRKIYLTCEPARLVDYDLVRRDGSVVTYEINAALKRDPSGKPCGFGILIRNVTQRRQAEEMQRQSDEKYRHILENMEEAYLETDLKGNFLFFNDSLCRLLGYSRTELAQMGYRNCIAPETIPVIFKIFSEIYRTDQPKRFINQELIAKNGSKIIVEVSVSLRRGPNGEPTGFQGIARDVTEKIKAERSIQDREKHLRLITDNIRDIIWTMDFHLQWTYLSPSVLRMTGFSPEEVMKIPLKAMVPSETYAFLERILQVELSRETGEPIPDEQRTTTFEMPLMHKNGKPLWVEISADFSRDENGKPLEIVGVTRDISERKKAEEALKESEKRYRMIIENMHEVVWTMDMNLQYTYFSPSCLFLTGHRPEELMKLRIDQVVTPESVALAAKEFSQQLEMESSDIMADPHRIITIEQEVYHKNGGTIVLEVTATFTRDENGKAAGLLMAGRDITARKKAEAEKDKLEEQLMQAQKMEIVGRLAGGVAHDFNNMLSVILGYADLAKMRLARQHPVLMDIAEIEKAAIRSRDITNQLLAFSRKQIIEPKIIDLNDLVTHTQKALIRLIGEDIVLKVSLEQNLWSIKFDPSQVEQILINLAVNARDAMPDGGSLTIETANLMFDALYCENHAGFTPGDYVRLSFSDNGMGMNNETLQHIFEPFFTTKQVGKGTGLGLSTVYGIVKQNSGLINVYSEPDHGTTFSIYVPRTSEERVVHDQSAEEPERAGTGNILLVEDDAMVLQITKGMLESIGYKVMTALNPLDALSLCRDPATRIDLVVSDVVMPGLSGKDLRDRLVDIRPDIKVLFMSGYTADVIAHHGILEEGVHFLQKPFTIKSLSGKVRDLMAKSP